MMFRSSTLLANLTRLACVLCALLTVSAAGAAEDRDGDYPSNLSDVYGAYQAIVARREACTSAFPQRRAASDKAYLVWHARHKKLIDELEQRVAQMIRGASRGEREYARNIGKYEGLILKQREEVKQELLKGSRSDLEVLCRALPDFLQSGDSDLEREFAEELRVVRKRPLARR
jgi:hypothetical protein